MGPTVIRSISLVATAICLGLGLLGMLAGFMYLSMSSPQDIAAGQAAFVAGGARAPGRGRFLAGGRTRHGRGHFVGRRRGGYQEPMTP